MIFGCRTRALATAILLVATLAGCQSIQPAERPAVPTASWRDNPARATTPVTEDWWRSFGSPTLAELVQSAWQNNPDLLIAGERVQQAEWQLRISGASLLPSLSLSAGSNAGRTRADGGDWQSSESSRVGLSTGYEIDLWGRVSAQRASARAGFAASEYDRDALHLSLTANVAKTWFQWLSLQARLDTAAENLRIAERVLGIVDARHTNGVATSAEVSRQQTNVLSQRNALLPLTLQARQTHSALALLLGTTTGELPLTAEALDALRLPDLAWGLPSDLLTRRPDLASAEAQLQAADANVAAARAALLPSVQLSASVARTSSSLLSLANPADSLSGGLSLAQTLFDGGRLRHQARISESQQRVLVEQYRKAILTALAEVEDALDRHAISDEQEAGQNAVLAEAERTLTLTEVRYREGSDDLLSLLEAQRSVFQAKDQLTQQRLARLNALVDLYKALGGGWQKPQ